MKGIERTAPKANSGETLRRERNPPEPHTTQFQDGDKTAVKLSRVRNRANGICLPHLPPRDHFTPRIVAVFP